MNVYDLNRSRRTVRKFAQKPVPHDLLIRLLDAARVSPSGSNLQPLRYRIIDQKQDCDVLFPHLKWAGYLPDGTPKEGERPTAYIIVVQDMTRRQTDAHYDAGAAMMAMTLCAQEAGVSSCWIASVDRKAVCDIYGLDENMQILLVLALGYPAQESMDEKLTDMSIRYWLDDAGVLHVPKRSMEDILF